MNFGKESRLNKSTWETRRTLQRLGEVLPTGRNFGDVENSFAKDAQGVEVVIGRLPGLMTEWYGEIASSAGEERAYNLARVLRGIYPQIFLSENVVPVSVNSVSARGEGQVQEKYKRLLEEDKLARLAHATVDGDNINILGKEIKEGDNEYSIHVPVAMDLGRLEVAYWKMIGQDIGLATFPSMIVRKWTSYGRMVPEKAVYWYPHFTIPTWIDTIRDMLDGKGYHCAANPNSSAIRALESFEKMQNSHESLPFDLDGGQRISVASGLWVGEGGKWVKFERPTSNWQQMTDSHFKSQIPWLAFSLPPNGRAGERQPQMTARQLLWALAATGLMQTLKAANRHMGRFIDYRHRTDKLGYALEWSSVVAGISMVACYCQHVFPDLNGLLGTSGTIQS